MDQIRVLLVEDDPVCRMLVTRILRGMGMAVVHASNGQDARVLLERDEAIDLIITDIQMPVQDGFALITGVRSTPEREGLPIICISVLNDRAELERLLSLGVQGYLLKPIDQGQLEEQVRDALAHSVEWRAARQARAVA
jgi:CheY-like chemotaxis protein